MHLSRSCFFFVQRFLEVNPLIVIWLFLFSSVNSRYDISEISNSNLVSAIDSSSQKPFSSGLKGTKPIPSSSRVGKISISGSLQKGNIRLPKLWQAALHVLFRCFARLLLKAQNTSFPSLINLSLLPKRHLPIGTVSINSYADKRSWHRFLNLLKDLLHSPEFLSGWLSVLFRGRHSWSEFGAITTSFSKRRQRFANQFFIGYASMLQSCNQKRLTPFSSSGTISWIHCRNLSVAGPYPKVKPIQPKS